MINYNCRFFRAAKPCIFNKEDGSECPNCRHSDAIGERILFIKLDAIGDVLRSASLLPSIISHHHKPYIAWLTRPESTDLVSMIKYVDEVITLSEDGLARVIAGGWDQVYSLSNDLTSASLASIAAGLKTPVGFYMKEGRLTASNLAAERWLEMAAFDRLKRENRLSYQRLMLDILDESQGPISPPALNVPEALKDAAAARLADLFDESLRPYVAINVGSGSRWPKKMLDSEQIYRYVRDLQAKADVNVVLVGGAAETEKANQVLGMFPPGSAVNVALTGSCLPEFVALLSWVDVLLCGDTLALHVATALGLPAVVVFGPTSSNEIFDFDGLVTKVWTPELDCLVCYGDCQKPKNCMSLLNVYELVDRTITHLRRFTPP